MARKKKPENGGNPEAGSGSEATAGNPGEDPQEQNDETQAQEKLDKDRGGDAAPTDSEVEAAPADDSGGPSTSSGLTDSEVEAAAKAEAAAQAKARGFIPERLRLKPPIASGSGPIHVKAFRAQYVGAGTSLSLGDIVIGKEPSAPMGEIPAELQKAVDERKVALTIEMLRFPE